MSKFVEWEVEGVEFANCNCSWGCPCQFNGLPTNGDCRALTFFQVDKGRFGDVNLDGTKFGFLAAWPAAIHLGNGQFQIVIDEKANPQQRKALETISRGGETEPGSLILQVFSATITKYLPPVFKPINLTIDYTARTASVSVPGLVEGKAESIRNPVTGAVHQVKVTMPTGFEFTESEVVSGKSKATGPIPLELDGSHGHLARIHWSTRGVVR